MLCPNMVSTRFLHYMQHSGVATQCNTVARDKKKCGKLEYKNVKATQCGEFEDGQKYHKELKEQQDNVWP